jgi:8-oxo-dGTP pyrophosphatase MutT (NUDIX family)
VDLKPLIKTALALHKRVELPPGPVPAAVLIPILLKNGAYHVLLTKRTEHLTHHRGQVSFPGGVSHPEDRDSLRTALRETWEEVGISPEEVDVLGVLDDFLSIYNYLVTPYVGMVAAGHQLRINPAEIERIIEVPLSFLLRPDIFRIEEWNWQGRTYPLFFFDYEGDKIWGLTAAILKQFLEIISAEAEENLHKCLPEEAKS